MMPEAEYTSPDGALRFLVNFPDGDITRVPGRRNDRLQAPDGTTIGIGK
jgi:hypothetical protein